MKDKLTDLGLLWLRALTGLGLMYHGWLKVIGGVGGLGDAVAKMGTPFDWAPMLFAWLAVLAALIGGFFILLGLWTRYASIALIIALAVAAFVHNAGNPIIQPGNVNTMELPLLYLTIIAAIFIVGPGRFSVDGGSAGGKKSKK